MEDKKQTCGFVKKVACGPLNVVSVSLEIELGNEKKGSVGIYIHPKNLLLIKLLCYLVSLPKKLWTIIVENKTSSLNSYATGITTC